MKITDIRMMRLVGPRNHGVGDEVTGGATVSKISRIFVRVDTDAGIHGLGEIDDFWGVRQGIAYMREYFMGHDPFRVKAIVSEMLYGTQAPYASHARTGVMANGMIAIPMCSPTATPWGPAVWAASGVEIALCDLVGKALKTPAYNLLGGKCRDKVKVYLDRSAPHDPMDLSAWQKMAAEVVGMGFRQMKFDLDYTATECVEDVWNRSLNLKQINRIVERLGTVRRETGPDFEICVDCHMHYNAPDAIRVANALAPLNLLWLEDPTPITSPDSCAMVRERSPIPICVGEMFIAEQCRLFVDHKACDILHPDVIFCGGMHELVRISNFAELHHLPVAYHGQGGAVALIAAAHVASSCRNFLGVEYHFIETPWIGNCVRRDGPLFKDGHVVLTDAPGLGLELDREVCRKHLAPGESLFD